MFELASTPQDLGDIIIQGVRLGRLAYRRLFTLTSVLAFLGLVPTMVQVWGAHDEKSFDFQSLDAWAHQLTPAYGSTGIVALLVGLLLQAVLIRRIDAAAHGNVGPLPGELRRAAQVWLWMLLALIVYAIAMTVGFILLVVPGVILCVSLIFNMFCVVLEGERPIEALNHSHHLVWGQWWRTLGMLVLVYLPLLVLVSILASLLGIGPSSLEAPLRGRDIFAEAVLEMVCLAIFTPFIYSILYVYYRDLKLRKQGT
ncbi:MAG TPA: hypothetical protein VLV87_06755 [Gammaproteobacteria bacterium]|nr:hypothetical protein [Gammaproteobacteria bacterium]